MVFKDGRGNLICFCQTGPGLIVVGLGGFESGRYVTKTRYVDAAFHAVNRHALKRTLQTEYGLNRQTKTP